MAIDKAAALKAYEDALTRSLTYPPGTKGDADFDRCTRDKLWGADMEIENYHLQGTLEYNEAVLRADLIARAARVLRGG